LNRYVYAIYFTYALISTIAFGDIIGKNYVEDVGCFCNLGLCYDFDHNGHHWDFAYCGANVYYF